MDKIKGKVKPAETHVKVQYEGEELSIRELVDRLKMYKALYRFWQNEAEKATKVANEIRKCMQITSSVKVILLLLSTGSGS